ncbi:MAG: class I adenylate-forming enzyme family protein [Methyloceanibacter sp.]|nr:class I adenylate-forming enzyme family protein [Methyloceanibacter sp.]
MVSKTHTQTWRELDLGSDRLASNLLALGLTPGDRVASLMPNRVILIVHYLACLKAGLVMTPLNYRYTPSEIDRALTLSGASALLVHAEREDDLSASKAVERLPRGRIWCEHPDAPGPSIEPLMASEAAAVDLPTLDAEQPALIFFTSGSTGVPKGVTLSRRAVGARAWSIGQGLELRPGKVVLPSLSLAHGGGFDVSMATLAAGGKVLVAQGNDPDDVLPLLKMERPNVFIALPSTLFALIRHPAATSADFASLDYCGSGGDVVPEELSKEVAERAGLEVRISYGMTEIGIATCNRPSSDNRPGSVGKPNPGYEMVIRGGDNREAATNTDGRLWVRSPANMSAYWGNPEATAAAIRDGWLDTGDIMRRDADGYLWFRGRQKQIIVHDGSNIWPQEVEAALLEHPAVAAAGVVGRRDEVHGEDVCAYVALKEGVLQPTVRALIDFARARVGYKAPEEIVFLDEMPLNSAGKIDRSALKQMAGVAR